MHNKNNNKAFPDEWACQFLIGKFKVLFVLDVTSSLVGGLVGKLGGGGGVGAWGEGNVI